jgi:glucose-6-phosphate isomerase
MLEGAHDIDEHFFDAPLGGNIPIVLGLLGVWNSTFMGYQSRCLCLYSSALAKFPPAIQKIDMESNGKRVSAAGKLFLSEVDYIHSLPKQCS